jgi:predicted enzyme related to lactoylglutathione lyase
LCIQGPDPRRTRPYVGNVTFSCAEPRRVLGPFWSHVLGWPEQEIGEDFLQMLREAGIDVDREVYAFYATRTDEPGQPRFLFQRRERSRPEHYPIELEFATDDLDRDLERLADAGAEIVERDDQHAVVRDAEGNPFTVG